MGYLRQIFRIYRGVILSICLITGAAAVANLTLPGSPLNLIPPVEPNVMLILDASNSQRFYVNESPTVVDSGAGNAVASGLKSPAGILTAPMILRDTNDGYAGAGNASEFEYISRSSDAIQSVHESRPSSRVGRQSWRRIF